MDNWRQTAHSITKYNPDYRDDKGAYMVNEWTSISDIGKEFNGIKFTYEDYVFVEEKYISSIREFCNYFNINELEIKNIELHKGNKWDNHSTHLKKFFEKLPNIRIVSINDLENLARLVLREYVWCDLVIEKKGIYFGYDFYMYFDIGKELPDEFKTRIQDIGLYIE